MINIIYINYITLLYYIYFLNGLITALQETATTNSLVIDPLVYIAVDVPKYLNIV